jgi:ribosome maturation factor RimP
VFLDGDKGITIGQCTAVNRALYPFIEEKGLFPNDDFSLEVSSAGIDEPLAQTRQYIKNVGRQLAVTQTDATTVIGTLQVANETSIQLQVTEGKGKKAITIDMEIPYTNIKTAIVQIKF